jgi:hypothetical protein
MTTKYKISTLESRFERAWSRHCPDVPLGRQYRFHPKRMWRFDYVAPEPVQIAIEIQGGIYNQGAHTRASGQKRDMEKNNAAVALGWRIFYLHTSNVSNRSDLRQIADAIIQSMAGGAS